jgi:hypothetical protein
MDWKNKLYFGDNLDILRREVPDASVDLIYLNPPFDSSVSWEMLFKGNVAQGPLSGPAAFPMRSGARVIAVEGIQQWGVEAQAVYREIVLSHSATRQGVGRNRHLHSDPFGGNSSGWRYHHDQVQGRRNPARHDGDEKAFRWQTRPRGHHCGIC